MGALATPKPCPVRVTTWCPQNGTHKNSLRPLSPQAGLQIAGLPKAQRHWPSLRRDQDGGLLYFAAVNLDETEGRG